MMISQPVPDNLILDPVPPGFTDRFEESGAMWFCAEPVLFSQTDASDETAIWWGRCGVKTAEPVAPNTGNSKPSGRTGISCLSFVERVNCGYVIPEAIRPHGDFSIAIVYAPSSQNEPRTLFTINPWNKRNYVFLSERDNAIELTDDQGSFVLQQPLKAMSDGFRLVVISYSDEHYNLVVEGLGGVQTAQVPAPQKDQACDLFVGCRSHRAGILKTLGEFLLADVFAWPGKGILNADPKPAGTETSPEYELLQSYYTEIIRRDL